MRIEHIILSDGFKIHPKKITVLVGPNNVGKSQFLKDIHNRLIKFNNWIPKIIQNIEFIKPATFEELTDGLYQNPHTGNSMLLNFDGLDSTLLTGTTGTLNRQIIEQYSTAPITNFFDQLGKFHVAHLDAQSKLQIATQRNVTKIGTPPPNLSQILLMDKTGQKKN